MQENLYHFLFINPCREVCHHKEAYVRRAVLFAASCILVALHPAYVSSALLEGNVEISTGLEWIRTWALEVAESDTDRECYMVSKANLKLQRGLDSMSLLLYKLFNYLCLYFGHIKGLDFYALVYSFLMVGSLRTFIVT